MSKKKKNGAAVMALLMICTAFALAFWNKGSCPIWVPLFTLFFMLKSGKRTGWCI